MGCVFDKNEDVDGKDGSQDHNHVHDSPTSQDHTERTKLIGEKLIVKRRHPEVGAILDRVEALGTSVDGSLCQRDQEWHQNERQEAKDQHSDHSEEVAE